jgi:hypothetical protein
MNNFPLLHNFNDIYTPPEALKSIIDFLPKDKIYWEACYGEGFLSRELEKHNLKVIGNKDIDCLQEQPNEWDVFITNPPFNGNKKFLKRAIELKKTFALLIRLEHLGGVMAYNLLKDFDFQIIIPEKRINFITPKILEGKKTGGSPFHCIWITHGLSLPKQINYRR